MRRHRILAFAGLLVAAVTSARARAQEPQVHWDDESVHQCVVPFEAAQRARLRGELVTARSKLPECLADACPARVRDDCTRMRDELDGAIPTVAFTVRDAAGNDLDATLSVDGSAMDLVAGRAAPIDPGPHVVTYTVAGEAPRTTKVRIYEGEKSRLIIISAAGHAVAVAGPAAPASAEAGRHTATPFIVGGIGILLAATSLYFVDRANGYADDGIEAGKSVPAGVGPCQSFGGVPADPKFCQANDNRKTATWLAVGTGVAGAGALGAAVAMWLLESRPHAVKSAARLVPTLGGASFDVTF